MPCAICQAADARFRCVDCADELCLQHATQCQGCGKAICPEHIQQTPGGRVLCASCMRARNDRHRARREERAQQQAAPQQPPAPQRGGEAPSPNPAGFSFQDLIADLPPVAAPPSAEAHHDGPVEGGMGLDLTHGQRPPRDLDAPRDDRNANALGLDDVPDPDIDRKLAQMLGEETQAVRILNASSPKGNPMWISGTVLGVITWGLCYYFVLNHAMASFQPLGNYIVIILATGAALWSISGLRNENEAPPQRRLNTIGLVLALTAGLIAALHLRH